MWQIGELAYHFTSAHGLPSEDIHFVLEDHHDHVWLGSENGLFRIPFSSFIEVKNGLAAKLSDIQIFTEEDGLPSAELIGGPSTALIAKNGHLWVATMNGVANIDPGKVSVNLTKPKVEIQRFSVQGLNERILPGQTFKTGKPNNFTFQYAAIDFGGNRRREYRTRLEGFEEEWKQSKQRERPFDNLNPGKYTFGVQGSNNDGIWSEPVSFAFVVAPLFYQTTWFKALLAMIPLLIVALIFRELNVRNTLRLARTRSTIADDLHDDIGSKISALAQTLSFISRKKSFNEEDAAVLEQQVEITQQLVGELRDSVWIVDSDQDALDQLIIKMRHFAETVGIGYEQHYSFPEKVPAINVPMVWRRNVYFIYKEALHNIIRHANASMIEIALNVSSQKFSFVIKDNGCGLTKDVEKRGRGLSSMGRRAKELKGDLRVSGGDGGGTSVSFSCDMP